MVDMGITAASIKINHVPGHIVVLLAVAAAAVENILGIPGSICPGDEIASGLGSDAVNLKWQRKNKGRSSDDNQSGDSECGEKHDFRMGWDQKGTLLGGGQLSGERSVSIRRLLYSSQYPIIMVGTPVAPKFRNRVVYTACINGA